MSNIDWGNAPSWLTVFGAATALLIAFNSLRETKKANKNQQLQIDILLAERSEKVLATEQAQASLVDWKLDHHSSLIATHPGVHSNEPGLTYVQFSVEIINKNSLPIRKASVLVIYADKYYRIHPEFELEPNKVYRSNYLDDWLTKACNQKRGTRHERLSATFPRLTAGTSYEEPLIGLIFRDSAGISWMRHESGSLQVWPTLWTDLSVQVPSMAELPPEMSIDLHGPPYKT